MKCMIQPGRTVGTRSPLLYGHFIEHFHRQIYAGVYDPGNPLSDASGLRQDVLEAMRRIQTPILRWPGGCFVSAYHWKDGVGPHRPTVFDKAWRVEDTNSFGTDEYLDLCRKVGCEPYICTNAGTGTPEEMSDWVEYCNLPNQGKYAKWRIANGHPSPYGVKYWSIGNENYGGWEIGAKSAGEWGRFVLESAKMMKHVDPHIQLSAAALPDLDWNINLLRHAAPYLDWISIHQYWDPIHETNDLATYQQCMAYTANLSSSIDQVRGLLAAMGLQKRIKIAFDEWNLRGWYHPNAHTAQQGATERDYLLPRDDNDLNASYTMADAVFTACFLNTLNRNCDVVGMANFAPNVNTRGCIYTHPQGMVLRSTYHVFDLFSNDLGDLVLDCWGPETPALSVLSKSGETVVVDALDLLATYHSAESCYALSVVNKSSDQAFAVTVDIAGESPGEYRICQVHAPSPDSYNDIDREEVVLDRSPWRSYSSGSSIEVPPHSVSVIQLR